MKSQISFLLILASLLFGCRKEESFQFEIKALEKETCISAQCATVNVSFPFYSGTSEQEFMLNAHIEQQLLMMVSQGEHHDMDLAAAIDSILQEYQAFVEEFGPSQAWEVEVNVRESYRGKGVLSIQFDSFVYMGGAHPNSFRQYLNIDTQTGSLLKNEEIIKNEQKLLALVERKFREHHGVEDGVSLEDDGRFFLPEDGKFFLPVSIGFEEGDFVVYYNAYEIGPYVMGPTSLKFDRKELEGTVRFVD